MTSSELRRRGRYLLELDDDLGEVAARLYLVGVEVDHPYIRHDGRELLRR